MDPDYDSASAAPRVMIVDDHRMFRQGLSELLIEEGFDVCGEAADGTEAVRLVAELAPDVAVMDLHMPAMGGIEATRAIREQSPSTRILVLTVSPDDEDVAEAIIAGASGYVLKDADLGEILAGVRAAANGEALLSSRIATRLLERLRAGGDGMPLGERPQLTNRETEVLRLIAAGHDNAEIAEQLFVSAQTVKNHVSNLLEKLQVENRIQAAVYAVRHGLA